MGCFFARAPYKNGGAAAVFCRFFACAAVMCPALSVFCAAEGAEKTLAGIYASIIGIYAVSYCGATRRIRFAKQL